MRVAGVAALVLAFASIAAGACGPTINEVPSCTPGASRACACDNGAMGAQTCNADGKSFGECGCSAGSSAGGASVASSSVSTVSSSSTVASVGSGGAPPACQSATAPSPNATWYSDPLQLILPMSTSTTLRKDLDGYPSYGVQDGKADIAYDHEPAAWTFQVPNIPFSSATLALSVIADPSSEPISQYVGEIWAEDVCLFAGNPVPYHGTYDPNYIGTNWTEIDLPVTVTPGTNATITFVNRSNTADPNNWFAIDWIEIRLAL
jgi:hypothetical protein